MTNKPVLTPELLRDLIEYDPATGNLTWRPRGIELFSGCEQAPEHSAKVWNKRYAGRPALAAKGGSGYHHGAIFGRTMTAHRAAWAIHHGQWPECQIDHINGDRADNRLANLRDVTASENCHNQQQRRDNTSGITGVHLNLATGKWVASIQGDGKMLNLGYFPTIEEAAAVRKAAERRFGFHPNHGRIAA